MWDDRLVVGELVEDAPFGMAVRRRPKRVDAERTSQLGDGEALMLFRRTA
jgi:hypothetical protein